MDRAQKAQSIEALKGVFADSGAVVVTHYLGLTVAEMTELRGRLREQGAQLKVVKNRLVQKAMEGKAGEAGDRLFKGPVAIVGLLRVELGRGRGLLDIAECRGGSLGSD